MHLGSRLLLVACLVFFPSAFNAKAQDTRPVLVFGAASLQPSLEAIVRQYTADTGRKITTSYAATSVLARQIEQGAPADLFISADQEWMDWAQQRHLIKSETRQDLVENTLVLISRQDDDIALKIEPGFRLAQALGSSRLAIGDPQGVPAGKYAIAALSALGVAEDITPKLAAAENVRTALLLVARGETRLGIVYGTDPKSEPRVRVVDTFPAGSHLPIRYPAAITAMSRLDDAEIFFRYLSTQAAQVRFQKDGFLTLK